MKYPNGLSIEFKSIDGVISNPSEITRDFLAPVMTYDRSIPNADRLAVITLFHTGSVHNPWASGAGYCVNSTLLVKRFYLISVASTYVSVDGDTHVYWYHYVPDEKWHYLEQRWEDLEETDRVMIINEAADASVPGRPGPLKKPPVDRNIGYMIVKVGAEGMLPFAYRLRPYRIGGISLHRVEWSSPHRIFESLERLIERWNKDRAGHGLLGYSKVSILECEYWGDSVRIPAPNCTTMKPGMAVVIPEYVRPVRELVSTNGTALSTSDVATLLGIETT